MKHVKRNWLWMNWNKMLKGLATYLVGIIGMVFVNIIEVCLFGLDNVALDFEWSIGKWSKYFFYNFNFFKHKML